MRKRAGLLTVLTLLVTTIVATFVVSVRGVPGPVVTAQGAGERDVALPR